MRQYQLLATAFLDLSLLPTLRTRGRLPANKPSTHRPWGWSWLAVAPWSLWAADGIGGHSPTPLSNRKLGSWKKLRLAFVVVVASVVVAPSGLWHSMDYCQRRTLALEVGTISDSVDLPSLVANVEDVRMTL